MLSFQQKRRLRSLLASRVTQGTLVALTLAVSWSAFDRYTIAQEMADRRAVAEAEVLTLEQRKTALADDVAYLSHERGIEAEMRRQFDVAREGEHVVVIVEEEEPASAIEPLPELPATSTRPWYQFW